MREGFTSNEFGATCGYKFDLAKGRAWLIGGGFVQDFDYSQTVQFTFGFHPRLAWRPARPAPFPSRTITSRAIDLALPTKFPRSLCVLN